VSLPPFSSVPARRPVLRPIPRWKIVAGVALVALLTVAVSLVLWWAATRGLDGKDLVSARMDALKVGLSIGIGSGGLFALYLGWRRQRSTEADLDNRERVLEHQLRVAADTKAHQERVAEASEADSLERRITDLYTKAADMLGSDKAPVRLAGLYALERLAQSNPGQRQTIVNVWCAYLRMPYTEPAERPAEDADPGRLAEYQERVQEREVRNAAQRLLHVHLVPGGAVFWADMDIDLSGATLINFDLDACRLRTATFVEARFIGWASFEKAVFAHEARFTRARFADWVSFEHAEFTGKTWFSQAEFADSARFEWVRFGQDVRFDDVRFSRFTLFDEVRFDGAASFDDARFPAIARFRGTRFAVRPSFSDTYFEFMTPPEVATLVTRRQGSSGNGEQASPG
jgi:hypothetical protein